MINKIENMKKLLPIIIVSLFLLSCVYASADNININGANFKIPSPYQGGEFDDDSYELENIFSIRCIDDNIAKEIGLWATEKDFSEDLNINKHPVRHFSQYNKYVGGNNSHAYFASGDSIYEIAWVGEEINSDIEKLINNTPESEIDDDSFYNTLDESVEIYKQDKIDRLNQDAEYNYLEAKYQSQQPQKPDDTRFKEILLTHYSNR